MQIAIKGHGKPILFVHGLGGSIESLTPLAKNLESSHQTITIELPGFGKSDNPEPDWGVEEYAQEIVNLLKVHKVRKVTYFGHSFGGELGIYLAANTKLIDKLILCNSSFKRTGRKSILARMYHYLFPNNNPPFKMILYRILFRSSDLAKFPHLEQNFRKIVKQDLTNLLEKINVKTLIIWGAKDSITPVSWAYELHEKIKNSELEIVEDARHGLPLRQPELVAKLIESFV